MAVCVYAVIDIWILPSWFWRFEKRVPGHVSSCVSSLSKATDRDIERKVTAKLTPTITGKNIRYSFGPQFAECALVVKIF
jgi:hypothetical protein